MTDACGSSGRRALARAGRGSV